MYKFLYINEATGQENVCHTSYETTLSDLMQDIKFFLLGCGYHPNTVDEYFDQE